MAGALANLPDNRTLQQLAIATCSANMELALIISQSTGPRYLTCPSAWCPSLSCFNKGRVRPMKSWWPPPSRAQSKTTGDSPTHYIDGYAIDECSRFKLSAPAPPTGPTSPQSMALTSAREQLDKVLSASILAQKQHSYYVSASSLSVLSSPFVVGPRLRVSFAWPPVFILLCHDASHAGLGIATAARARSHLGQHDARRPALEIHGVQPAADAPDVVVVARRADLWLRRDHIVAGGGGQGGHARSACVALAAGGHQRDSVHQASAWHVR
eukprot:5392946-Prymnesium_polylepis.1